MHLGSGRILHDVQQLAPQRRRAIHAKALFELLLRGPPMRPGRDESRLAAWRQAERQFPALRLYAAAAYQAVAL